MESGRQKIKIKLDVPKNSAEYYKSLEQWENEGGRATPFEETFPYLNIPIKSGKTYRVQSGYVSFEDGEFYFIADLERVKTEKQSVKLDYP